MTNRTDNFNRTAENPLNVPSDAGSAWVEVVGTDWQTDGTQAFAAGGVESGSIVVLEASTPDVVVECTFAVITDSPAAEMGLTARVVDSSNYLRVLWQPTVPRIRFEKVVAGSPSVLGDFSVTLVSGDTLTLECDASDNLDVTINGGAPVISTTDSAGNTGTQHGLFANWGSGPDSARWDNFSITEIGGAPATQIFLLTPGRTDGLGHGGIFPGGRL